MSDPSAWRHNYAGTGHLGSPTQVEVLAAHSDDWVESVESGKQVSSDQDHPARGDENVANPIVLLVIQLAWFDRRNRNTGFVDASAHPQKPTGVFPLHLLRGDDSGIRAVRLLHHQAQRVGIGRNIIVANPQQSGVLDRLNHVVDGLGVGEREAPLIGVVVVLSLLGHRERTRNRDLDRAIRDRAEELDVANLDRPGAADRSDDARHGILVAGAIQSDAGRIQIDALERRREAIAVALSPHLPVRDDVDPGQLHVPDGEAGRGIGMQCDFLTEGEDRVDRIFRYEEIEGFTHFLEDRLDCAISLPRVNVPPAVDVSLRDEQEAELRRFLQRDVALYETL